MLVCGVDGCSGHVKARSLCGKHLHRFYRNKPLDEKSYYEKSSEELFFEKVDKSSGDDGCWLWTGATGGNPLVYGRAWNGERLVGAHCLSYVINNGDIPEGGDVRGMCVCHTCDTPLCVNPKHLFLGTHKENMQDKTVKGRGRGSITHCKRGHEFTEENTWKSKQGLRHCKKCHAIRETKYRKAKALGG